MRWKTALPFAILLVVLAASVIWFWEPVRSGSLSGIAVIGGELILLCLAFIYMIDRSR